MGWGAKASIITLRKNVDGDAARGKQPGQGDGERRFGPSPQHWRVLPMLMTGQRRRSMPCQAWRRVNARQAAPAALQGHQGRKPGPLHRRCPWCGKSSPIAASVRPVAPACLHRRRALRAAPLPQLRRRGLSNPPEKSTSEVDLWGVMRRRAVTQTVSDGAKVGVVRHPITMGTPNYVGSRGLWLPAGTRLPPTKA